MRGSGWLAPTRHRVSEPAAPLQLVAAARECEKAGEPLCVWPEDTQLGPAVFHKLVPRNVFVGASGLTRAGWRPMRIAPRMQFTVGLSYGYIEETMWEFERVDDKATHNVVMFPVRAKYADVNDDGQREIETQYRR